MSRKISFLKILCRDFSDGYFIEFFWFFRYFFNLSYFLVNWLLWFLLEVVSRGCREGGAFSCPVPRFSALQTKVVLEASLFLLWG